MNGSRQHRHTLTRASVDTSRFTLNDVELGAGRAVADFHAVLGAPSRVVAGGRPAPPGHRNNQVHFYDADGLYLVEHMIAGLWSWKEGALDVGFQSRGKKNPSGPRSRERQVIAISVCFESDPFDPTHRPR